MYIQYNISIYVHTYVCTVIPIHFVLYSRTSIVSLLDSVKFIACTESLTNISVPVGLENGTTPPVYKCTYIYKTCDLTL